MMTYPIKIFLSVILHKDDFKYCDWLKNRASNQNA